MPFIPDQPTSFIPDKPAGFIPDTPKPTEKTWGEVFTHGYKRAGTMMAKQLAGLVKLIGEQRAPEEKPKLLDPYLPFEKTISRFEKGVTTKAKEWGDMMLKGVETYYNENPQEAIQITPDSGYIATLGEYITKPKNLVQGLIESAPMILEGTLGTVAGGAWLGTITMGTPITGEAYANAREEGTEPLPAMAQAILTGAGEATIEQWTLGAKLGLLKNFKKMVAGGLPKILWEGTKAFFRGTAEEGTQEFNRNFWRWVFTDRSQSWSANIAESAAAGGPMEMVMAGAFSGAGAVGTMVSNEQKLRRVEKIRTAVNENPDFNTEYKAEINKELDTVVDNIQRGEYDIEPEVEPVITEPQTADEAIGQQYGLTPEQTQWYFEKAEERYRELKNMDYPEMTQEQRKELTFLKNNRTDIEAILERQTEPKVRKRTTKELLALGHILPEKMGLTEVERRDFAELVTGKRSMKKMSKKEKQDFVEFLEDNSNIRNLELSEEDMEKPIVVAGRTTTMASVLRETGEAIEAISETEVPKHITKKFARKQKAGPLKKIGEFVAGTENTPMYHLANALGGGIISEVLDTNIQNGKRVTDGHKRSVYTAIRSIFEIAGITDADLKNISKSLNPRFKLIQKVEEALGVGTETKAISINDKTWDMTWAELIDFYLITNQADGIRHVLNGGCVINGVETGKLTQEKIDELRALVESNEKVKIIVDSMVGIGEKIWKPSINNTSLAIEGKEIAKVDKWWGLQVQFPKQLPGKMKDFSVNLIENRGIFKDRTKSNRPVIVGDAFDRFTIFENAIAEYVGMAQPARIARTLINDPDIAAALDKRGLKDTREKIYTLLKRAQSPSADMGSIGRFFSNILPGTYRAYLFYNPRVIVSQFTSVGNYGAFVSPEYMKLIKNGFSIKNIQRTLEMSDIAYNRFHMAHSSAVLGELAKSDATLRAFTGKTSDANKLGVGLKVADIIALTVGMEIATQEYLDAQNETITGTSAEYWADKDVSFDAESTSGKKAIADRAEFLWQRSQPSWDNWNRSMMTSSLAKKFFFPFRTFHEKSLTVLNEANLEYNRSNKTVNDRARQAQKYGAVLSSYTFNLVLRAAIMAAITRKIKEPMQYVSDLIEAPMAMFPVLGTILKNSIGNFINVLIGERTEFQGEGFQVMLFDVVNKGLQSPTNFSIGAAHYLNGDTEKAKEAFTRGVKKIYESVGTIEGVPASEMKRVYEGWIKEEKPKKGQRVIP